MIVLTDVQLKALRLFAGGHPAKEVLRKRVHPTTLLKLRYRGLLERGEDGEPQITDAGREALAEHEAQNKV